IRRIDYPHRDWPRIRRTNLSAIAMQIAVQGLILRHGSLFDYFYRKYADMHFSRTLTFLLCSLLLSSATVMAQTDDDDDDRGDTTEASGHHRRRMEMKMTSQVPPPTGRWYMSNSFDAAIFSTAVMERPNHRRD